MEYKVNTGHNIGDIVIFGCNESALVGQIISININLKGDYTYNIYGFTKGSADHYKHIEEKDCFSTNLTEEQFDKIRRTR